MLYFVPRISCWHACVNSQLRGGEVLNEKELQDRVREAQREYFRKWRAENPERVKANRQRYWLRKAEQMEKERKGDES